jgi:hypothetical protein
MHADQGLAEEIENEVEQLMGRVMSETGGHLQRATAIDDHGRDAVDRALLEVRMGSGSNTKEHYINQILYHLADAADKMPIVWQARTTVRPLNTYIQA